MNDDENWSVSGEWYVNVPYDNQWKLFADINSFVTISSNYAAEQECEKIDNAFDKLQNKTSIGENMLNSIGIKT